MYDVLCGRVQRASLNTLSALLQVAEDVVVAGGGAVAEDKRYQVDAGLSLRGEVLPATDARAFLAAFASRTADSLIAGDRTAGNDEDGWGAGVARVRGGPVVEETAAPAAAAVAAGPAGTRADLVAGEGAARDGEDTPKEIRNAAPQGRAAAVADVSLAADCLVIRNRAIAERGRAPSRRGHEVVSGNIHKPTTDARVHEGAGRVVVPPDGLVAAERHVAEGQANGATGGVPCKSEDRPTHGRADELEAGEVPPVAVAPAGLVVLERAVRDRGFPDIDQTPAGCKADIAVSAGTGVVGAADGLVAREGTSAKEQDSPVGIEDASAAGWANEGAGADVVRPPTGQVAQESTILHSGGTGIVIDAAAAAETGVTATVPGYGLVVGEDAIGDGGDRSIDIIDAAGPGWATTGTADGLIGDEPAVADRDAAGHIENGAAVPLTTAVAAEGLVLGEPAVGGSENRARHIGDGPAAAGGARGADGLVVGQDNPGEGQSTSGV